MTNFEKWKAYTTGLSSPENYIDWTWRYIIASSLQRRVWCPPEHQPCFANQYTVLVGKPGIGKGIVIRVATDFLSHWKLKDAIADKSRLSGLNEGNKATVAVMMQEDAEKARAAEVNPKSNDTAEPLLIPMAPDATTYEALVEAVAKSHRMIEFKYTHKQTNEEKIGVYGHCSICFTLQELASLLRKRTDDTVNYLLGIYDCPTDYQYLTKTQGKDRVRRGCLNILAGTTPHFMSTTFDEELIGEGFTSRTFFIFADKNRKNQFWIPQLTDDQKVYKQELLNHIFKLSKLYGQVHIDDETKNFLTSWWDDYESHPERRLNKSPKMIPYYARKNIHVMKVAMADHFGESTEMHIPLFRFQEAIKELDAEERNMHYAIVTESTNNLSRVASRVVDLLKSGPKNFVHIMTETFDIATKSELQEAITFLEETHKVTADMVKDEITNEPILFWRLNENN